MLVLLFLMGSLLLFSVDHDTGSKNTLQEYLDKFGVSLALAERFSANDSLGQIKKEGNTRLMAEGGGRIIRVEILAKIDGESARKHVTNRRYAVDSLFLDIAAPYPDVVTTTLECPEQFRPKVKEINIGNFETAYYEIFATERLTYGACSDDLIKYKTILTWAYCENSKNLFQMELFVPKSEFNGDYADLFNSFKCGK